MTNPPTDEAPRKQTTPSVVRPLQRRDNPDTIMDQVRSKPPVRQAARIWVPKFLASYRLHGNISAAARAAGIERTHIYTRMAKSPKFKAAIEDAFAESTEVLEAAAFERATKDKSDAVLMFLLKARRPTTYKDIVRTEHALPPDSATPMTFTLKIGRDDADAPLSADNGRPTEAS